MIRVARAIGGCVAVVLGMVVVAAAALVIGDWGEE